VTTYTLTGHGELLAVVRLGPGADLPSWAGAATILSVTATATETSVVCAAADIPARVHQAGPFVAFEVQGPLDFALTGVLAALLTPLADAGVSVFTLSTFDTDWILVNESDRSRAVDAWQAAGHTVVDGVEKAP
jgi:hypothetical protein